MGRRKKIRPEETEFPVDVSTEQEPEPRPEDNPPAWTAEPTAPPVELPAAAPPEPAQRWRFVSNTYPNMGFGFNGTVHHFVNGVLETDDPALARALENHRWFRLNYHRG
jgi:hypothetical protein